MLQALALMAFRRGGSLPCTAYLYSAKTGTRSASAFIKIFLSMKINSRYFILSVYLFFLSCSSFAQNNTGAANDILPATSLRPFGRSLIDQQQNLELISSAVHFGFSFSGKECAIYAFINDADGHNYLQYELDGVYQKRVKIIGDSVQQN